VPTSLRGRALRAPAATAERTAPMPRLGHVPALDGLRGIAILLVVAMHSYSPIFSGGGSGVDLFFVLSGFLITKLAYEEHDKQGTLSLKDFYRRRMFRILPALLVVLAFVLFASFTFLSSLGDDLRVESIFAAGFASNIYALIEGAHPRYLLAHTWSLGLEEQFYWVWPVLLAALPFAFSSPKRFARTVVVTSLALAVFGRVVVAGMMGYPHWESVPLFNADGLALGCGLAILVHEGGAPIGWLRSWMLAVFGAIVTFDLVAASRYEEVGWHAREVILRLLFAAIVFIVVVRPPAVASRILANRVLGFFGRISFSLYLWHGVIFFVLSSDRYPGAGRVDLLVAREVLSILAAVVSYHLVEQPALRYRKRVMAPATPRPAGLAA
jgi:peptidoglycan/LPS O-acetylase OafA/YrhL